MKKFVRKNRLPIAGALVGAVAGYFYWQQVGCVSGTCSITSHPFNSTLYGTVMGALSFSVFQK